jgi:hypothetical protein
MAMVAPNFVAPVKREATLWVRYGRSHHFTFKLAIDAILSTALVFGAFQLATVATRQSLSSSLKNSGAVAFSAKDLEKFIKDENLTAYWAGPKGNTNTPSLQLRRVRSLFLTSPRTPISERWMPVFSSCRRIFSL